MENTTKYPTTPVIYKGGYHYRQEVRGFIERQELSQEERCSQGRWPGFDMAPFDAAPEGAIYTATSIAEGEQEEDYSWSWIKREGAWVCLPDDELVSLAVARGLDVGGDTPDERSYSARALLHGDESDKAAANEAARAAFQEAWNAAYAVSGDCAAAFDAAKAAK